MELATVFSISAGNPPKDAESCDAVTAERRLVVAVVAALGPAPHYGGVEAVVDTLVQGPLRLSYDFRVFDTFRPVDPGRGIFEKLLFAARLPIRFRRFLKQEQPDLVHFHYTSRVEFWKHALCLLVARRAEATTVFHLHGAQFAESYDEAGSIGRLAMRAVLRRATRLVALSDHWQHFLSGLVPNARIEVLPNPVDPERLRVADDWLDRLGPHVVLLIGSLGRRKGQRDAIEAFASVLKRCPDAQLVLAGQEEDSNASRSLTALAQQLNIAERVLIVGPVSGNAKSRLLQKTHALILPSYAENMPISVLEGMALGKPVIASRVGAVPEMIDDEVCGMLVDPGDVHGLAERITRLLEDEQLAARLGDAARARVGEQWHVDVISRRVSQLYRDLITSAQPSV